MIICRCEEVSREEILAAVRDGAFTVREVKRCTRAGMGLCQGRTCGRLVAQIVVSETGQPAADVLPDSARPPVRPLPLGELARELPAITEE